MIFGEPKTAEQIAGIAEELARTGQNVLVTRIDAAKAAVVKQRFAALHYSAVARTATLELSPIAPRSGRVAVVTAGTADMPVAEEAAETLRMLGIEAVRVYDVGVAGIHRLLERKRDLDGCAGVIVVAGMEGALPSVVGGTHRAARRRCSDFGWVRRSLVGAHAASRDAIELRSGAHSRQHR